MTQAPRVKAPSLAGGAASGTHRATAVPHVGRPVEATDVGVPRGGDRAVGTLRPRQSRLAYSCSRDYPYTRVALTAAVGIIHRECSCKAAHLRPPGPELEQRLRGRPNRSCVSLQLRQGFCTGAAAVGRHGLQLR